MDVLKFAIRKLLGGIPLILGVTFIAFLLMVYFGPDLTYEKLGKNPTPEEIAEEILQKQLRELEQERFEEAEAAIRQAIQETPDLQDLAENLLVDMTPEGPRIQIVDREGNSMFPSGSAQMYD